MKTFRWGILGTGSIAHKFAQGLLKVPGASLVAVGSRTKDTAGKFGQLWKIDRCYSSYQELAHDVEVDGIYIATPHHLHMENTLMCIEANKPVLCEKPFAINANQAKQMIDRATEKKVLLMEAMWTRFNPVSLEICRLITEGVIGDIQMFQAHFGFRGDYNPLGRLLNPAMGGGALLDVGVYCISYASMIFGKAPQKVSGYATLGETGVDEQSVYTFEYERGGLALMSCAVRTNTPHEAIIMGTNGTIRVPDFWHATYYMLNGKKHKVKTKGNLYNYEAVEFQKCFGEGKLQSDRMPLSETLHIMQTMDTLRKQWGLIYPME